MTDVEVAVVGAGVSGLATAYRLQAAGYSVRIYEAEDAVGGRMRTRRHLGYLIDEGAETLAPHGYPATWELIRDLAIRSPRIPRVTSVVGVWRDGRARPWVGHPLAGITGAGLGFRGRMALGRISCSILRNARRYDDEHPEDTPLGDLTVAEFCRNHPREIHDYLFQPAAGTAFGWLTEQSCAGPLVTTLLATRGIWKWRTYLDGMDALARELAERVPVHTRQAVREVKPRQGSVRITLADGDVVTARSAVLAVPAPVALDVFPPMPQDEQAYLRACTYAPMIRVCCLLDRPVEPRRGLLSPHVYALLLPDCEDGVLGGVTIDHNKAANRAPAGRGLISLLPSPRAARELIGAADEEIVATLLPRAERYLPGVADAVREAVVRKFPHGAPEATSEALARRPGFTARPLREVEYAGDWVFQRPSSEAAVRSSLVAVRRVRARSGR